jgi:anti-sigma factor RsiW
MPDRHLSAAELEGYVRNLLDPGAELELEAHVAACERCAARLQSAARLELQLAEIADAAPRPTWRRAARLAPLVALAAGVAALLLMPREVPRPVSDDGEPWAPDAPRTLQTTSVHFDISDLGRRSFPRYEQLAPVAGVRLERAMAVR